MNERVEFLNYVYQNTQMGTETIDHLMKICEDEAFCKLLKSQHDEYAKLKAEAEMELGKEGKDAKEIGMMQKLTSYIMINVNTLTDKSPSHLAEMMIQGSTMGIIDITKNMQKYENIPMNLKSLGERLVKQEQINVEELKKFLK